MKKLLFSFIFFIFFISDCSAYPLPPLSEETILMIGLKVWANESRNSIQGLTSWNKDEEFASMGIGHFLWSPLPHLANKDQSFPVLIHYQEESGITVPSWLQGPNVPPCPWKNREAFLKAQNSRAMLELRQFLAKTVDSQSKFLIYRLQESLNHMLKTATPEDRLYLEKQLHTLTKTATGLYILTDYLNFKGLGLQSYKNHRPGFGLMSVLLNMKQAPRILSVKEAFAWSADELLTLRAKNSHQPYAMQWLPGWRQRLKTYTDTNVV